MWMSERLREREKSLNFFLCMHSHIDIVLQPLGFITNGNLWCSCWDIIDLYYPRVLVWDHIFQQYLSFDWNALYYACYSIKKDKRQNLILTYQLYDVFVALSMPCDACLLFPLAFILCVFPLYLLFWWKTIKREIEIKITAQLKENNKNYFNTGFLYIGSI
jgi:hypothetical protein